MHQGPLSLYLRSLCYICPHLLAKTSHAFNPKARGRKMYSTQDAVNSGSMKNSDQLSNWPQMEIDFFFFFECLLVAWYCARLLTPVHLKSVKQCRAYSSHYFTSFVREVKWFAYCIQWIWDFNLCLLECKSCDLEEAWYGQISGLLTSIKSLFPKWPSLFQNLKFYVAVLLLSHFSRVQLCSTPETATHQAPPSLGFSRQEHWSGLPFPCPMHGGEKSKWSRSVMSDSLRKPDNKWEPTV